VIEFKRRRLLAAGVSGDYVAQLASLEAALRELAVELKIAELGRNAIKNNAADQTEIPDLLDHGIETAANPELEARIKDLEQKMDALKLKYTDQHPDVVALARTLAQLEDQKRAETKLRNPTPRSPRTPDPISQQPKLSLATAEANVAAVKARIEEFTKRYEQLKSAAIAAPQVDAEYAHLSRDYEMAKSTYASMLSRREVARISDKMESTAGVTNFRVVDPPRASPQPKAPNRPRLNSMVLVVALGGGIALAYLMSQVMPTIRDERRLREVSGAPVLGSVLKDWTKAEKRQRIRSLIAFLFSFLSLLSAYAAVTFAMLLTARA
jgi:polysaccharide chain length determinant protein (PEP-CTERM system associated)